MENNKKKQQEKQNQGLIDPKETLQWMVKLTQRLTATREDFIGLCSKADPETRALVLQLQDWTKAIADGIEIMKLFANAKPNAKPENFVIICCHVEPDGASESETKGECHGQCDGQCSGKCSRKCNGQCH